MKKLIYLLAFLITFGVAAGQPKIKFYLNDGSSKSYNIEEIENINFIKSMNSGFMRIYTKDSLNSKLYISDIDSITIDNLFGYPGILNIHSLMDSNQIKLIDVDSIVFYQSDARMINGWVTDLIINRDKLLVSSFNDFNKKIDTLGNFLIRVPNNNLPQIVFLKSLQDSAIGASIIKTTDSFCNINSSSTAAVLIFFNTMLAGVSLDSMKDNVVDFINDLGETSWIADRIEPYQNQGIAYSNAFDDTLLPVLQMAISKVYKFITGRDLGIVFKQNKSNKNDILLENLIVKPDEESGIKVEAIKNNNGKIDVTITNNRMRHINIRINALSSNYYMVGQKEKGNALLTSIVNKLYNHVLPIKDINIDKGFTIEACGPALGIGIIGYPNHEDPFYSTAWARTVGSLVLTPIDMLLTPYIESGKVAVKQAEMTLKIATWINNIHDSYESYKDKGPFEAAYTFSIALIQDETFWNLFVGFSKDESECVAAWLSGFFNSKYIFDTWNDLWWINEYSTFFVLPDITKDLEKPKIQINSIVPNNNKSVPLSYINVFTTLTDNIKLGKAYLYIDNDSHPYQSEDYLSQNIKMKDVKFNWFASKNLGIHKLHFVVYDEYGNHADTTINIEVCNSPNDNTKPTVEILSPSGNTIPQSNNATVKIHLTDDNTIYFWNFNIENQTTKKYETIYKETLTTIQNDITKDITINTSKYPIGTVLRFYIDAVDGNWNKKTLVKDFTITQSQIPTKGLVAYYPFNGNANDESGNNHNGTKNGSVSLTNDRFGNANKAYNFSGGNITIPTSGFHNPNFTISCWIKPTTSTSYYDGPVIYSDYDGYYNGNTLTLRKNGTIDLGVCGGSDSKSKTSKGKNAIPLNQWSYITATYNGSVINVYINGNLDNTLAAPYFTYSTKTQLKIGDASWSGDYHFNGTIDELRVYSRALSESEIQALFNEK